MITEIIDKKEKMQICNFILRGLPNWFGIEKSIIDYVNESQNMTVFAAKENESPIGFIAIKTHNKYTAEVSVMGVAETLHKKGIGKKLIQYSIDFCKNNNIEFLTVKTLAPQNKDPYYAKTRLFYEAMGFRPLEVFDILWDEVNPCLFMAMNIK